MIKQPSAANASIKELRGFGIGMALFCLVLGTVLMWKVNFLWAYRLWIIGAIAFLGPALLFPLGLRPVYRVWIAVASKINWVISRLVLMAIFFLIFTLVSFIQKIIKRDPMDRKFPGGQESYWIDRSNEPYNPKHFERLF